jgi:hypothetical protein
MTCFSGDIDSDNYPAYCLLNIDGILRQNISQSTCEIDKEGGFLFKLAPYQVAQWLDEVSSGMVIMY